MLMGRHVGNGPLPPQGDHVLYQLGASWLWDARRKSTRSLSRGSRGTHEVLYVGGGTSDEMYALNMGTGQFELETYTTAAGNEDYLGTDGFFSSHGSNFFNSTTSQRSFTADAGITVDTSEAIGSDYIIDSSASTQTANRVKITNLDTVRRRFYKPETASSTYRRVFQVYVRDAGGHEILGSAVTVGISRNSFDDTADVIETYRHKIALSDQWYVFKAITEARVDTSIWCWIELDPGVSVYVEGPMLYSYENPPGSYISGVDRIPWAPSGASAINFGDLRANGARDSAALEGYSESGWVAGSCTRYSREDGDTGYVFDWYASSTNTISCFIASDGDFVVRVTIAGVTEVYLDIPSGNWVPTTDKGRIGWAYTWGKTPGGSNFYMLAVNGKLADIETIGGVPIGSPSQYTVGNVGDGSGTAAAGASVHKIAVGRRGLDRSECRNLSLHMQQYSVGDTNAA